MEISLGGVQSTAKKIARSLIGGSVLGIDLGSSCIKIVQLRKENGRPVLETYGSLEIGPYGDLAKGEAVNIEPKRLAAALLDLLHEVDANARRGGMSIPLSSTFISIIESPKREPEQKRL